MNNVQILREYEEAIYRKIDRFLYLVEKHEAIKSATIEDGKIHIEFSEPVDVEGQDIINVFIRGGVIKKSDSKDNIEEQYFEVPAIGGLM